jgi:methylmalonyl-CoA epimerase
MIGKIDHIGIAVRDLTAARRIWEEALGLAVDHVEEVASEKVRTAFLTVGESRLELLESTSPEGPIAKFIAKRGEGVHHVCFRVDDVEAALALARAAGLAVIGEAPRPGAHGARVAFLHPGSAGGVLIELAERPRGKKRGD